MISTLRHLFVDSWIGRILAFLIFLAFIGWGVGDIFSSLNGNDANTAVRIGSRHVTAQDLDAAIRAEMPQVAQQMGLSDPGQLPPATRQQVAHDVLQRLVSQNTILALADRNGMRVPDDLVRNEVFGLSYFHGTDGKFDRKIMNQRLAKVGMTERELLDKVRDDITARNLMDGLGNSAAVPASIQARLVDYDTGEHILDIARIDATAQTVTVTPTDAQLLRYYDNHPWAYQTAEYRHAKVVVLSEDTVARSLDIPEADLRRFYEFQSQRYNVPETRALEVVTFQNAADAKKIVDLWKGGADWSMVQAQAKGAAAVAFPETRQSDVPSPELAKAAFSAPKNSIEGPLKTETGWVVYRVTSIQAPHNTDFEHAKDGLRDEVARAQAPQLLNARVPRFQDAVAGSADLEHIPTDIGAAPAQGTLDMHGMTREGEAAPLPGDAELRQAIITRIFSQKREDKPNVVRGPKGSAFAVLVDNVTPGAMKPFDDVREQVRRDWMAEQQRHLADQRATAMLTATKDAGSVAAAVKGTPDESTLIHDMAISRVRPAQLPRDLVSLALSTGVGQSGMLNVGNDYFVFTVTSVRNADPVSMRDLMTRLHSQLEESLRGDIPETFVRGLEDHIKPVPNMPLIQRVLDAGNGNAG